MKQPREIEYPNTRLKRQYGKRIPANDLEGMANQHSDNAYKELDSINKGLEGSGWKYNEWLGENGENLPYYHHKKSGYTYYPSTKHMVKIAGGSEPEPSAPNVDYDAINRIAEQNRLAELAQASSDFGVDLYHDANLRSGKTKLSDVYDNFKPRVEAEYEHYTDDDLYAKADEVGLKSEMLDPYYTGKTDYFDMDRQKQYDDEYDAIIHELMRRKKERGE